MNEILPGTMIRYRCQGCNKSFTWLCYDKGDIPPAYHSHGCANRSRVRRNLSAARDCPTPGKVRYETGELAHEAFRRVSPEYGILVRPYACRCGWHHLGRMTYEVIDDPNEEGWTLEPPKKEGS